MEDLKQFKQEMGLFQLATIKDFNAIKKELKATQDHLNKRVDDLRKDIGKEDWRNKGRIIPIKS